MVRVWFSFHQSVVAQSSGEAELYAIATGAAESLFCQTLLQDLGFRPTVTVKSDSTAGIAIGSRVGLGKLKHVDIKYLHVQQLVQQGRVKLGKVPSSENPSDLGTKFLDKTRLQYLKQMTGIF